MYKTILVEDECAPDALEFFKKEFEEIVGESLKEFIESSDKSQGTEYSSVCIKGKYKLTHSADCPQYYLYEEIES